MGVSRGNSVGLTKEIQQCELCACWTRNGAFVGSVEGHFVCRWCKREADNNWFVRAAVQRWERLQG
jgi:hypothetical protein